MTTTGQAAKPVLVEWAARGDFPALLDRLEFSLALSVRPDALLFVGSRAGLQTVSATPVPRAMGLAAADGRLAIASDRAVAIHASAPELAPHYPAEPGQYDAYYTPRAIYLTGPSDMHDMAFVGDAVIGTNTNFSCICRIGGPYSFAPIWHPRFITKLCPEDRCHLNGFAVEGGELRYVTSLSGSDERSGWRRDPHRGGLLIDARSHENLRADLCMPHSPRVVDGRLFVLNGGEGEVLEIDRATGESTCIVRLPGFTHGLCHHAGYLFVGLSHDRVSRTAGPPPVAQRESRLSAGLVAIEIQSGRVVGSLEFTSGVSEVYDVQALPGVRQAGLQALDAADGHLAVDTPHAKFWTSRTAEG